MSLDRVVGKPAFTFPLQKQNEDLLLAHSQTTQQLKLREERPKYTYLGGI